MRARIGKFRIIIVLVLFVVALGCWLRNRLFPAGTSTLTSGNRIHSVSFSPDDQFLAVASLASGQARIDRFHWASGGVQIWQVRPENQQLSLVQTLCTFEPVYNPESEVGAFYSTDGKQLIVQNPDRGDEKANLTTVYNASNLEETNQKPSHYITAQHVGLPDEFWNRIKVPDDVYCLAVASQSNSIAIGSSHGTVAVFDKNNYKKTAYLTCNEPAISGQERYGNINALVWLSEGHLLWVLDHNKQSIFWDPVQHRVLSKSKLAVEITCAAVTHRGDYVAYGNNEGVVRLLSVKQLLRSFKVED